MAHASDCVGYSLELQEDLLLLPVGVLRAELRQVHVHLAYGLPLLAFGLDTQLLDFEAELLYQELIVLFVNGGGLPQVLLPEHGVPACMHMRPSSMP